MNKIGNNIAILILMIMVFFGYMIGNLHIMLYLSTFIIIIINFTEKIKISSINFLWLICTLNSFISISYSIEVSETLKFTLMLFCLIIIKIYIDNNWKWKRLILNIIWVFSSIHTLGTIFQFINADIFYEFIKYIINAEQLNDNMMFYSIGNYAGLTAQTGMNVFYISIFVGISFCEILFNANKSYIHKVGLFLGMFALFLTGKRGPLITNIIAIIIVNLIVMCIDRRKISRQIKLMMMGMIVICLILATIPEANTTFEKFSIMKDSGDITNGRTELWQDTNEVFLDNVLLGIGMASIPKVLNQMSHNIYIQLLAEVGIVGFICYLITFILSFISTISHAFDRFKYSKKLTVDMGISIYLQTYFLIYGFTGNPLYGHTFLTIYLISISLGENNKNLRGERNYLNEKSRNINLSSY